MPASAWFRAATRSPRWRARSSASRSRSRRRIAVWGRFVAAPCPTSRRRRVAGGGRGRPCRLRPVAAQGASTCATWRHISSPGGSIRPAWAALDDEALIAAAHRRARHRPVDRRDVPDLQPAAPGRFPARRSRPAAGGRSSVISPARSSRARCSPNSANAGGRGARSRPGTCGAAWTRCRSSIEPGVLGFGLKYAPIKKTGCP